MKQDFEFLWFLENLGSRYSGWMEQACFSSERDDMDIFATYFAMSV